VYQRIRETVAAVCARHGQRPEIGLILGSGLGAYADRLTRRTEIPFEDLPNFPRSGIPGHAGKMVLGEAGGMPAVVLQGRVHFYEGYSIQEVVFPVRVLGALGIRQLIVTNAAGGVNLDFQPGDFMLIKDHINLTGTNPLIGRDLDEHGVRFPDMSEAYDATMRDVAADVAAKAGIPLRQGIYIGLTGPSFETPAEIRMCRLLGADAVGMSTVAEVIVANQIGIRVLGISCITNMAAGILPRRLTHEEVMDTAARTKEQFISLLSGTIPRLPAPAGGAGIL
jgi:purine-nucleoside phosphorylase